MPEIEIKDLTAHENNPRYISKDQYARLEKTLEEFGDLSGVVFNSQNGKLVGGHMRTKIFKSLKSSIVITEKRKEPDEQGTIAWGFVKDGEKRYSYREVHWDEPKHEKAMLIANKAGGDFDFDMLANHWDVEFLIDEIGFESAEFGLEQPEELEPTEGDDDVPESAPAITVKGDLYELGNHRVLCGDSTMVDDVEKLLQGEKADMIFTDPPYGVDYEGGHLNKRKREKLASDNNIRIYSDVIPIIAKYCTGPCYTWYSDTKPIELFNSVNEVGEFHAVIIWHKINATYAALNAQYKQRHEPCLYWKPKGTTLKWCGETTESTLWELKRDSKNEFHPTQKPVELSERAINNHTAQTVLDLFLGSGSTLISCEKTKRTCFGMEISEKYCDVIVKRYINFCRKNNKTCSVKRNGKDCLSDFED